jgi:hypothetical protein
MPFAKGKTVEAQVPFDPQTSLAVYDSQATFNDRRTGDAPKSKKLATVKVRADGTVKIPKGKLKAGTYVLAAEVDRPSGKAWRYFELAVK